MFDPAAPRLFGVAPGCDFATTLAHGLIERMKDHPPEAMARVTLWLGSSGMRERVRSAFPAPMLLPRIRVVTELDLAYPLPELSPPEPPLRRRLQLTQLIARLLDAEPDLAPKTALYDLADSLASLMDEMAGEGVLPEAISDLDVSEHSLHWARTQKFLSIVTPFFGPAANPASETRRRRVAEMLPQIWAENPPPGPVIVAGSTGSRGGTALMMKAVYALPQGAIVMPGHDFDMPHHLWDSLGDALTAEDHPQYRTRKLMNLLGVEPHQITPWAPATKPPSDARNALVSLALRPAPVTDQWLSEGDLLPDLLMATQDVTLIEAASPRAEALSVALLMRHAAEKGQSACLVSPDRDLARQVSVALDRWGIVADDSAGRPLPLTPPGRLLRQVGDLFGQRLTGDRLLGLLKHPLVHSGEARGEHTLLIRDLEMHLRRKGPAFPDAEFLRGWAAAHKAEDWGEWLASTLDGLELIGTRSLSEHVALHREVAERLADGPRETGGVRLWAKEEGRAALAVIQSLEGEAEHGGELAPFDYNALFDAILGSRQVRDTVIPHPLLRIQGSREAREVAADLVILGSLNDASWPQLPPPDPWLNRQMRLKAGLLLPERRIGLSAHDFQQAVAAPEVVLTRAVRGQEAESVPSRWLNRLMNLMQGLPQRNGPEALREMRARGNVWMDLAKALEKPEAEIPRAKRPSPAPPVSARPRELPVTGIERLIRDPYEIYAGNILKLRSLDPLRAEPDSSLRGSVLHKVMEKFALAGGHRSDEGGYALLERIAEEVLEQEVPWPAARLLWKERILRVADWFLEFEAENAGTPVMLEASGSALVGGTGFTLTARPDRIDVLSDGRVHLYDYKTGSPPTKAMQKYFNQQLLLQAAMAERGAFGKIGPSVVAAATYIGLGSTPKAESVDVDSETLAAAWAGLEKLVTTYLDPTQGYTARRAMQKHAFGSNYDQLSRFGEWNMTDEAEHIPVEHKAAEQEK